MFVLGCFFYATGEPPRSMKLFLATIFGIFWMPPGECSHPGGSEYVWQRGVEGVLG